MKPIGLRLAGGGLIAFALVAGSRAPVAAQTMVCTTVTTTTIEYLSNGGRIIDRRSYSVCYPIQES